MKYSLFIGRWQPWHDGHRWLIDQRLNEGKNVCIAIRDVEPNENQPYTSEEVYENICIELQNLVHNGRVRVIIIPDITHYGTYYIPIIILYPCCGDGTTVFQQQSR